MTQQARGTFDVQAQREPPYESEHGITLGRARFAKQFQGDLSGESVVHMLSALTPVQGSAGYVAVERVHGSLAGKSGSFVLLHHGVMTRGTPELSVTVVPDTGTHELSGLAGRMRIDIVDGKHFYTFDYTLTPAP